MYVLPKFQGGFTYLSLYFIDFRIDFNAEKTHVILSISEYAIYTWKIAFFAWLEVEKLHPSV